MKRSAASPASEPGIGRFEFCRAEAFKTPSRKYRERALRGSVRPCQLAGDLLDVERSDADSLLRGSVAADRLGIGRARSADRSPSSRLERAQRLRSDARARPGGMDLGGAALSARRRGPHPSACRDTADAALSDPTGDRDPGQRRTGDLRAGDFRGRRSPASVFWRADFDPAVLTVRAAPVAAADGDAFRLDRLPCRATVRRLGGGREQIIIGEGVRSIRIEVREGSVLSGPTGLRPRGVRGPRYRTACARSVRSPPPGRPFVAHAPPGGTTGAPLGDGPSGLGRSAKRRRASARSSLPCSVLIALRQTGRWTTT